MLLSPLFWLCFSQIDASANASFLGWMVAAYSLGQMVASPLFGWWSNHRPRREPLVCSIFINLLANIYYAYAYLPKTHNKYHLLMSRVFVGFGAGIVEKEKKNFESLDKCLIYQPKMELLKYTVSITLQVMLPWWGPMLLALHRWRRGLVPWQTWAPVRLWVSSSGQVLSVKPMRRNNSHKFLPITEKKALWSYYLFFLTFMDSCLCQLCRLVCHLLVSKESRWTSSTCSSTCTLLQLYWLQCLASSTSCLLFWC